MPSESVNRPVGELKNLGPRCESWLAQIDVYTEEDLRGMGAPAAYRELVIREVVRPHRMLLYALAGALLEVSCMSLTRSQKRDLDAEAGIG